MLALAPSRVMLMNGKLQPNEIRNAFFFKEIRAGMTTFATMAYIIAVNVSGGGAAETARNCSPLRRPPSSPRPADHVNATWNSAAIATLFPSTPLARRVRIFGSALARSASVSDPR